MKLNIEKLSHSYDVEVLHNLNFSLDGYKSIAIIGVSGSGKSTLIRLMSGMEKPTTGEIDINSMNVSSEVYRKKIGFVFQNHNLFPHLSLKRNISLILEKTRNKSKEEAESIALKRSE
ncbi:MAG: ATP-binding cassette domain-containing protein, partial [Sphaerochaetaceae bacterium]|nr:ATP-binding cassette domain-containing protein [Sphaerochaetaceae bacterium]